MIYRYRRSALEPETTLAIEDGALRVTRNEAADVWPLPDIALVRLSFNPSRFDLARYQCRLIRRGGEKLVVTSTSFVGFGRFENQRDGYRDFIAALHQAMIDGGAVGARFMRGDSPKRYWSSLGCAGAGLLMLLVALLVTGFIFIPAVAAAKLVVLLVTIPWCVKYARVNRPADYDPRSIPSELLP